MSKLRIKGPMTISEEPNAVRVLLQHDHWDVAQGKNETGVSFIRYRTPVLYAEQIQGCGYGRVLKIVWIYAPEGSGALPSKDASEQMAVFEDRLCAAVEHDSHAILTAVLTFDGARQWVFYTDDVHECGARLEAMPQEAERYPLELTADDDPEWSYLREVILKTVPWQQQQRN